MDTVLSTHLYFSMGMDMLIFYLTSVTLDVGIVIEGTRASELPEQMLGCVRIHRLDPVMAPSLPSR